MWVLINICTVGWNKYIVCLELVMEKTFSES